MTSKNKYLILSLYWTPPVSGLQHDTPCKWWGPDQAGYVEDVDAAGRYSEAQAVQICEGTDRAIYLPGRRH